MHIYLIVTTWKNIYKKFIIVSEIKIAKKIIHEKVDDKNVNIET